MVNYMLKAYCYCFLFVMLMAVGMMIMIAGKKFLLLMP